MKVCSHVVAPVVVAVLLATSVSWGQQAEVSGGISEKYTRSDVMIPVRDGIRLHTQIWTPKLLHGPLPFIFTRSPYGWSASEAVLEVSYKEMAEEQYIFVFQDIRGRYESEGQFVMLRPVRDRKDLKAIDESTDTYDSMEWLLKNVPQNNGRIGVLGISYGGWLTVMAMIDPHPALKAVSEQASPADMFLGDDFHHNGAFRLSYAFEYASAMERGKVVMPFEFGAHDTYDWYLRAGPLSTIDRQYLHGKSPSWEDFLNHPNYDQFWKKQAVPQYLDEIKVPNLNVAGWYDQEDFYGPMAIYEALEKHDHKHLNYLVVGPWNHGGWARRDGRTLGRVDFVSDTSQYFREKVQAKWFAYWLKDKGPLDQPEALIFQTGSNDWKSYNEWPPKQGITKRRLYFHDSGKLVFDPPRVESPNAFDSYVSDPNRPVPYRDRPIPPTFGSSGRGWTTWLTDDQRFVHLRPDVLSWETNPLEADVTIAGDIVARLFASTTGSDSDWIIKLIDVYPDAYPKDKTMGGYQLMIADEVFRARFRRGFEHPEPVPAGQVIEYDVDLHTNDHCFLKGHRIMVQVQSTWFPLIDRNPQRYVENIYKASALDYQRATQRIFRSKKFPSHVELPVMTGQ